MSENSIVISTKEDFSNLHDGYYSNILGGRLNNIIAEYSTIGGGIGNNISDTQHSTIGGGAANNIVKGSESTIAGGIYNLISCFKGAIGKYSCQFNF